MADAHQARAERRAAVAARVAQTTPVGDGCARRALSSVANAGTGPAGHEQQASSLHPLVRVDGTTRNMPTCDHHYWSLNGHCFPFVTFL